MAGFSRDADLWRWPALFLWVVFFIAGMMPEPVFMALRRMGDVTTGDALVNSPYVLSLAFSAYIGLFSFCRCWNSGLSAFESQDRALQLTLIALVAFLPIDPRILLTAYKYPALTNQLAIYVSAGLKIGGWWYLVSLFFKYYVIGIDDVFSRIPSFFPSARRSEKNKTETVPEIPLTSFGEAETETHESATPKM